MKRYSISLITVDPEKVNRNPWGTGRGKKVTEKNEANHKRLLKTENKLRVDGGWEGGEGG